MTKWLIVTGIALLLAVSSLAQALPADTSYLAGVRTALRAVWPANRTVTILFHGHSVPAGYGDKHEVHTLDAYPQRVLEKLKARYIYAPVSVIVTAIGGENSVKGEARFREDVLNKKPDVILIDYALNDRGVGLQQARQAWEKMIRAAQAQHIPVILLTPSPDQRVDLAKPGNELELHARQVRELAATYHTGLVDSYALFHQILLSGGKISDYMASVNHPNRKGHELIADEVIKWFQPFPLPNTP